MNAPPPETTMEVIAMEQTQLTDTAWDNQYEALRASDFDCLVSYLLMQWLGPKPEGTPGAVVFHGQTLLEALCVMGLVEAMEGGLYRLSRKAFADFFAAIANPNLLPGLLTYTVEHFKERYALRLILEGPHALKRPLVTTL